MIPTAITAAVPLQLREVLPEGTQADVFQQIFGVFLVLGTLVGVVVIGYMLYNAYRYRAGGAAPQTNGDHPELGELPEGGGKGRKLFVSFALSAVIVLSLIVWTYAMLLYVEGGAAGADAAAETDEEPLDVDVEGFRFGWEFTYPNGHTTNTLRVPADRQVNLNVTSRDVFHTFGVAEFRVKTDAIPGQTTSTWFVAEKTGTYQAECYELCGAGHSFMTANVTVMEPDAYREWYANTSDEAGDETETDGPNASDAANVAPAEVAR